jgi:hypothetical protein
MSVAHDSETNQKAKPGKFLSALGKIPDGDLQKLHDAIAAEIDRRSKKKEDRKSPADMTGPEFERWSRKLIEEGDSND